MLTALRVYIGERPHTIDVVDVDADEALVAKYDELVPVLLGAQDGALPVQLCHYFLDEARVAVFMAGNCGTPAV